MLPDVKIIYIFTSYQGNKKNLFLYYKIMSENDLHLFLLKLEKEIWEDNFPEYEKENDDDE